MTQSTQSGRGWTLEVTPDGRVASWAGYLPRRPDAEVEPSQPVEPDVLLEALGLLPEGFVQRDSGMLRFHGGWLDVRVLSQHGFQSYRVHGAPRDPADLPAFRALAKALDHLGILDQLPYYGSIREDLGLSPTRASSD